ncbi:HAD-IIB family hydrolase [Aurantimonas sp. Leaf443]|uniref:HAD-IIB family hydrolase n=1 Tax=Aurantimonas sp. Leaf443 TaxID=1736378 RepID=UPI0006F6509B|nr:HAD-IIB family hydrolase [Aurantimonas sp. Leaf443]KQT87432.1 HAD family hydrolase [Aurantimonas sp. Leaf443]
MFILHIALQGCLKGRDVDYGLTADTGGHIKYLLELVEASAQDSAVTRIVMATRRFESPYGPAYEAPHEQVSPKVEIVRLASADPGYLPKEALHREIESYTRALLDWIAAQPCRPDLLHAHYADAGAVAAAVKRATGIPFVFTAHSLGRVKASVMTLAPGEAAGLERRIAAEETALAKADLVIASSRDEAEVQYAGYRAYDPGAIRILPPGSDLSAFRAASASASACALLTPFLRDPQKPPVLAIARPVAKKNLPALVRAFGENAYLRENANLVVVAGIRGGFEALDDERAGEMRAILELVDRYDLYGKVALPKSHRPEDVPALYAFARERRGVFVNPALNEPFGLTLLEAAAAGLPLVATDCGGPNDIIEMCHNGLLVDPRSPGAIAGACETILRDPARWDAFSRAGARAVDAYDWPRHAARYHGLAARLLAAPEPEAPVRQLLVCDIDNTLVGGSACVSTFRDWHARQSGLGFAVATGRSLHSALSILEQQDAPSPRVIVSSVGSEIYRLRANGTTYRQDAGWRAHIAVGWQREAVARVLAGMAGIAPQGPLEQRAFKLSYFAPGGRGVAAAVRRRLQEAGLSASVIHSHGKYLDILPVRASKGAAVAYLRKAFDLAENAVFVAGDSGNDIEMLRSVPQSIIVANYSDGLAARPDLAHSYVARQAYALGIIEGVAHFRRRAALA